MIRRLIPLLACTLLVASCANIPEQTAAQVIPNSGVQTTREVQLPGKNTDPITFVRRFIEASGDTEIARAYLTEQAKKSWRPENQPTIIDDNYSTVPQPVDKEAEDTAVVEIKGVKKGSLDSYRSFIPQGGPHNGKVKLVRQDGQWRINEVPNGGLTIPFSAFTNHYRPVNLYFYDPSRSILVPDRRYLPGAPLASARDVVDLLLGGPAAGLQGAVKSALPPSTVLRTNVTQAKDSVATVVNLGELGNLTAEDKQAIAAQIVLSLQEVAATTVRLQVENLPLLPDRSDWKVADVPSASDRTTPKAQLAGMMVVGGRIKDLKDGNPIGSAAGAGIENAVSAAQSVDGSQLAVVERTGPNSVQLRVGPVTEGLRTVLTGPEMTRPTWQYGVRTDEVGNEVWTVNDGVVTRLVRTREGAWDPLPVNQTELAAYGKITELRLSRDGVRVAVVADGKLYVGAVARSQSTGVSISAPKQLLPGVSSVVSVDWENPSTLAVATNMPNGFVWRVPVDGIEVFRYNLANLTVPLTSITAAPSRPVIVTDANGMWTATDIGQFWLPHPHNQGAAARPFYPG
ncbi:hypothetical protein JOF56_003262 [Kibdelosporangium banguiense]|uniref:GerMN domain-containing protein n=1 Tax=Kibdelosporangium banguiense TaxID=1365924 RepID=A0ABS4TEN2_9PSEU|nr:LpqB family beta-propeller domain-containing protein [Kibdelosporangium banguiense]MBP2322877.1 hypothetical protein [Kibdelosporangium banguiense]